MICRLNLSDCLNSGRCLANSSFNSTYCQCDPCHYGDFCENDVWKQTQFDTHFIYMIISFIGLAFSLLNNGLALELFIRCKHIRCTNCGTYLIAYAILSILAGVALVLDGIVKHDQLILGIRGDYYEFHCYFGKIAYSTLNYICIWLGACIIFERGLFLWFGGKINASRWRSFVLILVIFVVAGGSMAPMLFYKCAWNNRPSLQTARIFFMWFYPMVGITAYILATILVLGAFTKRVRKYRKEAGSFLRTYLKLFRAHLFIFIPAVSYGISVIPYSAVMNLKSDKQAYFQCGISTAEYSVKVILEALTSIPVIVTWLLFVYPSRVYRTEFYLNTSSGKQCARIWLYLRPLIRTQKQRPSLSLNSILN